MDAWLIVVITIASGLTLFIILFSIKLRKNKREAAQRAAAYSATVIVQPSQIQDPTPQMSYPMQQIPYPPQQNQNMPYAPQQIQSMPYPPQQNQSMPYPPQQNQQMPYPPQQNQQMPYPPQQNQPQIPQSNYTTQTQSLAFVPSTNSQPLFNHQNPQQYNQGLMVNPSPSAPTFNRIH